MIEIVDSEEQIWVWRFNYRYLARCDWKKSSTFIMNANCLQLSTRNIISNMYCFVPFNKSTLYFIICGVHKSMKHSFSYYASDADIHIFPTLIVRCVEIVTELEKYINSAPQRCRSVGNPSANASLKEPVCASKSYSTSLLKPWKCQQFWHDPCILSTYFVIYERGL